MNKEHFDYDGIPLGVTIQAEKTIFRIWALNVTRVTLNLYKDWRDMRRQSYPLEKGGDSIWSVEMPQNLEGMYYTYSIEHYGTVHEIVDPYAVASSPNSKRGYLIDLSKTDPEGWDRVLRPHVDLMDTVIYETHVRDVTVKWHEEDALQGTFNGVTTPLLETISDLGVTHIQWMPVFDFARVDELGDGYNWGYDPVLFNVVEGSYASDVMDPCVRIRELKAMIQRCHSAGLRVIMDVVYNHTYKSKDSNLNRIGFNYFYRMKGINDFSNGSGCGNELATERAMVRKFIIDSLLFWQKEYQIDGFRFDLMGLYDIETVDYIQKALKSVDSETLLYGEPWIGGTSTLEYKRQFRKGVMKEGHVGYFNDDFRNMVKGDNDSGKRGYIGGLTDTKILLNSLLGSYYDGVEKVGHTKFPWESINYLTSHDNLNLFDKISRSFPDAPYETKKRIVGLCFSILLTSVGLPFIQGGAEMMTTKQGHHNTYNMGDDINAYDWSLADFNSDLRLYIKRLIAFRRDTFVYQEIDFDKIRDCTDVQIDDRGVIIMRIEDRVREEIIFIYHNGCDVSHEEVLEPYDYEVVCDGKCFESAQHEKTVRKVVELPAYQTVILKRKI
ncbi:MAG: type I pullulanase [Clostridia bacterium]|nr:type I pullulanase [Clostridia bacterium]